MIQVVARVRSMLDPALERAMADRLAATYRRQRIPLTEGRERDLARSLCAGMLRAVAARMPESAPVLAEAARNAASGITLSFDFSFADRNALDKPEKIEVSALRITPGIDRV